MLAPLSQVGMNELFPMLKALEKEGADGEFASWARQPANAGKLVQLYRESIDDRDLVVVPDVSSREILQQLIKKMGKQFTIDKKYLEWDFLAGECGKCYEAFQWDGGECVQPHDVWNHFRFLEADGNVGAFVAWLLKHGPALEDWYMTLPSDPSKLYVDPKSGNHLVTDYARDEDGAVNADNNSHRCGEGFALCLEWKLEGLDNSGLSSATWIAFREVK